MKAGILTMKRKILRSIIAALALLAGTTTLAGEQITYFHNDVLGSPIAATDQKGYVMWRATYEPYGERLQSTTDAIVAMDNTRWYGSHVQDDETGLLYMQARYQDPQLGRFLSIDPEAVAGDRPATFNRYAYGANNPYRYVDPDGRDFWEALDRVMNPFSNSLPSYEEFQADSRYLLGGSRGFGREDDPGYEIMVDQTATMFQSAARDTAKVGDNWVQATLMAEGGGGARAVRTVAAVVKAPVIIGETMARVQAAANRIRGAKILNNMPDFKAMGMNADQVTSSMMQFNRKWILEQLRSGRQILDLGLDAARSTRSIFYQMEQAMIRNFRKLHPDVPAPVPTPMPIP